MTKTELPLPELGLIAATRGMLGAGIALLLSDRIEPDHRKTVGRALVLIGALSTIPLVIDVLRKRVPPLSSDYRRVPREEFAEVA